MLEISFQSLDQKNINTTQNTVNSVKCFQSFDWYNVQYVVLYEDDIE